MITNDTYGINLTLSILTPFIISQEKSVDLIAAAMEIDILEMNPKYLTEPVYELLPGGTLDRGEISTN